MEEDNVYGFVKNMSARGNIRGCKFFNGSSGTNDKPATWINCVKGQEDSVLKMKQNQHDSYNKVKDRLQAKHAAKHAAKEPTVLVLLPK